MIIKLAGSLLGLALVGLVAFYFWATSGSYPQDRYTEIVDYPSGSSSSGRAFTAVSYNLGYLSGLTNNQAVQRPQALFDQNLEAAIAALDTLNIDVLALQEIDVDSRRSYGVNQVEALALALGFPQSGLAINWNKRYVPFPYWPPSAHFGKIVSGQAVLSRYPIGDNQRTVLQTVASRPFFYNAVYLDRLAQVTTLTIDGQTVVIINIHLEAFDTDTRLAQTRTVRAMAEDYAKTFPVIVLGDFNSALNRPEEGERSIDIMVESEQFAPVFPQEVWESQPTFPSDTPQYKLDYGFYTPATLTLNRAEVITAAGQVSDHLPLAMDFTLAP